MTGIDPAALAAAIRQQAEAEQGPFFDAIEDATGYSFPAGSEFMTPAGIANGVAAYIETAAPSPPVGELDARCGMCGGLGWILDCNDVGKPGPRQAELLPCLLPDCAASGQPLQSITFGHSSAGEGWVMAVRNPIGGSE